MSFYNSIQILAMNWYFYVVTRNIVQLDDWLRKDCFVWRIISSPKHISVLLCAVVKARKVKLVMGNEGYMFISEDTSKCFDDKDVLIYMYLQYLRLNREPILASNLLFL